jgi:hypothetical protein
MGKKELDTRFARFGTVSFASVTQVNDFVDYLDKGRLMGTKCSHCGLYFFPPRAHCCQCLSQSLEWFEVTGQGRLVSYSTLRYAPAGFQADLPYTIGLLDYGQYKVFGRLSPLLKADELRVGMAMKARADKTPAGQVTYVFETA